jgi:hypothetical protein
MSKRGEVNFNEYDHNRTKIMDPELSPCSGCPMIGVDCFEAYAANACELSQYSQLKTKR